MKKTLLALCVLTITSTSTVLGSEQIVACAEHKTGKMRVVDNASICSSREYPLAWNITGALGPQGEQGIQGDPGENGEQGETGLGGDSFTVFDGNDNPLGFYVDASKEQWHLITDEGYRYYINRFGEIQNGIYNQQNNYVRYMYSTCTGQAYTLENNQNGSTIVIRSSNFAPSEVFYIPNEANEVISLSRSYAVVVWSSGERSCSSSFSDINVKPVYPNDPAVTGVPNYPEGEDSFPTPLYVGK